VSDDDRGFHVTKPIVFFDLETTHVDVDKARIVELGAIKIFPSGKRKKLELRIRPGIPIPAESTEVHGIKDSDVVNCPLFEAVAQQVYDFFNGCDLGGFNIIRYDILVLSAALKRVGLTLDLVGISVIDTCKIYHMREPRDLSAAVAMYTGGFHLGAHSAMADAQAALQVLLGQLEMYSDLPTQADQLFAYTRDSGAVDVGGKISQVDGELTFTWGKHRGEPLWSLPTHYLEWALVNIPFGNDAAAIIRDVMARRDTRRNIQ